MSTHISPRRDGYITPTFEHPTTPFPSTESFFFPTLPRRTTSISPSSIPLSPPVPSRKAPAPPRRVPKSRVRNQKRLHMQMVEPEQVGLWTLVEDTEGEASATTDNPEWLWGAHRARSVNADVQSMLADVDATKWRSTTTDTCVGLGIQGVPMGDEKDAPREVFDGLFYVPPAATEGSGFRLWRRDAVDSPTSSESSFGTLDSPPSPTIPATPHADRTSGRRTTLVPPPPLTFTSWDDQEGRMVPLAERLPLLLQSPFTPSRRKPTPLAESPAREGRLLASPRSTGNAFETPVPSTVHTSGSSTSASSIASTCSSTSDGPITPRSTTTSEYVFGGVPMAREHALGDGKPTSLALERFLRLTEGSPEDEDDDEWYLPAHGFPLPPSFPLPSTPEPRIQGRPSPPAAPRKPSAGRVDREDWQDSVPRSCRALQDATGIVDSPSEDIQVQRRTSLPEDSSVVHSPTPSVPRRGSDGSTSPVYFEFILDINSAPRREKLVLRPTEDVRPPVWKTGVESRRRGLPARKGLPRDWMASVQA